MKSKYILDDNINKKLPKDIDNPLIILDRFQIVLFFPLSKETIFSDNSIINEPLPISLLYP